ncbi:hypothetical protein M2140_000149 [Clostridiales Family XIII bacterium PM5-7]
MLNIENLVINRVLRGTLVDKATGEIIVSVDQISDASLECSGEQVFTNDALGQKIAAFDRSKDAKFTASNALINFGLMAAQLGSEKEIADATNKIVVPAFELIDVEDPNTVELLAEPYGELKYIYSTHADKSKNMKYTVGVAATDTEFAISGKTITLPTGAFAKGDRVAVWYERETENAVKIRNTTTDFSKGGKFILEVLACDVCDVNTEYYTYVIFGNGKMDNNITIDFSNEAKQQFVVNALQDYCSAENELFSIVVAD